MTFYVTWRDAIGWALVVVAWVVIRLDLIHIVRTIVREELDARVVDVDEQPPAKRSGP